jgi:hypothetical protein
LFPRYTSNLFQFFTSLTFSKRLIKEQLENDTRASFWFYGIYFLSTAFLIYEILIGNTGLPISSRWYILYGLAVSFTILLLVLRIGFIRLIGWIFNGSDYVESYLFNKRLVNEFAGLLLFPLCVLILLSTGKMKFALLIIAFVLYFLMFSYSYLRNLSLLRNLSRISFLHFLLYLCAFEVIPILIFIKILS